MVAQSLYFPLFICPSLLCVQCYAMHGQCVCVCVCVYVRHTFCQLAYSQTPQRIFTVDSLKDMDLRKDVPFRGLDDE